MNEWVICFLSERTLVSFQTHKRNFQEKTLEFERNLIVSLEIPWAGHSNNWSISCLPPFSHHFSSQMPCLFCPSRQAIPFWDFCRPHHSPISYVLYFDKSLPEAAILFDTPCSTCCWSSQNFGKSLLDMVGHLGNECFPGCLSGRESNAEFYLPEKKDDFLRAF